MQHHPVIIIGAGVAGLTCATYLHRNSIPFLLIESADEAGGRVRTDYINGFQLDRGFQIFLTSYPEAKKVLNYEQLRLQAFRSGAIIRQDSRFVQVVNPLKEPLAAIPDLFSPIGSLPDKIKILKLAAEVKSKTNEQIFSQPATSTAQFLSTYGWSKHIIQNFFKPFFGGVFLERELSTSSNFFQFVFKQFAVSDAVLPMRGIQAIPDQLTSNLPPESIRKGIAVKGITDNKVYLASGEVLLADCIVLAVDASAAAQFYRADRPLHFQNTSCLYFAAPHSPLETPMLVINSHENSLINNMCVPSDIAARYAPSGKSLISVSVVREHRYSDSELLSRVREELTGWFGQQVQAWGHLKTYHIPKALPAFTPADEATNKSLKLSETLYRCGDYTAYPSLNGAMQTGRIVASMAAEKIAGMVAGK